MVDPSFWAESLLSGVADFGSSNGACVPSFEIPAVCSVPLDDADFSGQAAIAVPALIEIRAAKIKADVFIILVLVAEGAQENNWQQVALFRSWCSRVL
jgi:hypothetical protein